MEINSNDLIELLLFEEIIVEQKITESKLKYYRSIEDRLQEEYYRGRLAGIEKTINIIKELKKIGGM